MTTPDNWQKSSYSGGGEGNACIELGSTHEAVHLRESDDPHTQLVASAPSVGHLLRFLYTIGPGSTRPHCRPPRRC